MEYGVIRESLREPGQKDARSHLPLGILRRINMPSMQSVVVVAVCSRGGFFVVHSADVTFLLFRWRML
jgi:hypothetical protein